MDLEADEFLVVKRFLLHLVYSSHDGTRYLQRAGASLFLGLGIDRCFHLHQPQTSIFFELPFQDSDLGVFCKWGTLHGSLTRFSMSLPPNRVCNFHCTRPPLVLHNMCLMTEVGQHSQMRSSWHLTHKTKVFLHFAAIMFCHCFFLILIQIFECSHMVYF